METTSAALPGSAPIDGAVFECSPLAMWVQTNDRRIVAANDATCRRYGFTRAELLGMTALDLRPPGERPHALRAGPTVGHDVPIHRPGLTRHQRKDGRTFWVDVVSHAITFGGQPARLVIALDVDAQVEAEQALHRAHAQLRAIVDAAPLAIYSVDAQRRPLTWNRLAAEVFGFGEPRATQSEDPGVDDAHVTAALEGSSALGVSIERKDSRGLLRELLLYAAPIRDARGHVDGVACVALDLTAQRALEAQLLAAQRLESLGLLAAGVAHDFNNLLTVILAATHELAEREQGQEVVDVQDAAERAAGLIRQLLRFGRATPQAPRAVDVETVVGGLVPMLRRVLRENIRLALRLTGEPLPVLADAGQLEQVVSNLVVNAGDALTEGGTITVAVGTTTLEGRPAATLSVEDDGPGIRPTILPHVFDPFFTTKIGGRGTGLGLATVHTLVERWGGSVVVENLEPHGARFMITLPSAPPSVPSKPPSHHDRPLDLGGRRILVVDDDPYVCRVAGRVLEKAGATVQSADSVAAACRALERERFDLLLLDYVLPDGRGPAVADHVAKTAPGTRVLYSTGHVPDSAGPLEPLLQKPYDAETLRRSVGALLRPSVRP